VLYCKAALHFYVQDWCPWKLRTRMDNQPGQWEFSIGQEWFVLPIANQILLCFPVM
jgi:hypothetical protein